MAEQKEKVRSDALARNIGPRGRAAGTLINFNTADLAQTSFSLAAGNQAIVTMTLSSAKGLKLFAVPEVTLYQTTIASGNEIPDGANVTESDYRYIVWVDYGASDGHNLKCKTFIKNLSGSTKTIYFAGDWRYIVEDAS